MPRPFRSLPPRAVSTEDGRLSRQAGAEGEQGGGKTSGRRAGPARQPLPPFLFRTNSAVLIFPLFDGPGPALARRPCPPSGELPLQHRPAAGVEGTPCGPPPEVIP